MARGVQLDDHPLQMTMDYNIHNGPQYLRVLQNIRMSSLIL